MKEALRVTAALVLAAASLLAQGAFTFGNKNLAATPPIDAKVMHPYTCEPLSGTAWWTQAYIKLATDPDSSYAPVGTAANFRTGNNAGYIVPQVVMTTLAGGTVVNLEMRVWEASGGSSFEAAVAAGKMIGKSMPITLRLTAAPATPSDMVGLQSFGCIPEPSSLALGVLGAALLWRRQRPEAPVQRV